MDIKLSINLKAKKTINRLLTKEINEDDKDIILNWLNDTNVKCYILYENNIPKCFALLSKCDYDPFNLHVNPYILNLIYTFEEYRRNNLAYNLLIHLKTSNYITAFCKNDVSVRLFEKAEYIKQKERNILPTFRFP
jgi:hypothetical protein